MSETDAVYAERNKVVAGFAALAIEHGYRAGVARTAIEGWAPEWHNCVYIDLPSKGPLPEPKPPVEFVKVRKNNPLKGDEIGRFTVSAVDAGLLDIDWHKHDGGYWTRQPHLPPPHGYLHKHIARRIWGEIPDGYEVDHIDRTPDNMTRSNLRLATPRANKHNQTPRNGVRLKPTGKWTAQINGMEKYTHIGTYDTEEEARAAYAAAKVEILKSLHDAGEFIYPPSQISWHFHDRERDLFAFLPPYPGEWDGHDTDEKYRRVVALTES